MKILIKLCIVLAVFFGCAVKKEKQLIIFHAGSLSVPFKEITAEFNKIYPEIKVLREIDGSRNCARKISELNKPCDVFASADYEVIDSLLIPKHADWNIKFVANEMTIVFTEKSKFADKINKDNWIEILLDKEVAFGRSEPNADPCGYRTVLTIKLAEQLYKKEGIMAKFLAKDTKYLRPKEVDLLALLETGEIDYLFLYRSVAEQHGLKYLILDDKINLKKPEFADLYKTVSIELNGKTPGTVINQKGAPMIYGVTIPKNSPNTMEALLFIEFLLSKEKGVKIMEKNGQPNMVPSISETYNKLPERLKIFALPVTK